MTILAFPALAPSSIDFGLMSNTQVFSSPLSKTIQGVELPGARWVATLTFENMAPAQRRLMTAFLVKLRGQSGRFYLWDFSHAAPAGIATGTPVVHGASQVGTSLVTTGWTVDQTGILLAGDYFTAGSELKMLVDDANSDSAGDATLVFEPPLRSSPGDTTAITLTQASCSMLTSEDLVKWSVVPPNLSSVTIQCFEDIV